MTQFIFTNILMISLGTILYLVIRSLPRIDEHADEPIRQSLLQRLVVSEIPEKTDALLNNFLGKFL